MASKRVGAYWKSNTSTLNDDDCTSFLLGHFALHSLLQFLHQLLTMTMTIAMTIAGADTSHSARREGTHIVTDSTHVRRHDWSSYNAAYQQLFNFYSCNRSQRRSRAKSSCWDYISNRRRDGQVDGWTDACINGKTTPSAARMSRGATVFAKRAVGRRDEINRRRRNQATFDWCYLCCLLQDKLTSFDSPLSPFYLSYSYSI